MLGSGRKKDYDLWRISVETQWLFMKSTKYWNTSKGREGGKFESWEFMTKSISVKIRFCISIDQSKLDSSRDN